MKAKNIKLALSLVAVLAAVRVLACADIVSTGCPDTWVDGYQNTCNLDHTHGVLYDNAVDKGESGRYLTLCPQNACWYDCNDPHGDWYGGPASYRGTMLCNGQQVGICS